MARHNLHDILEEVRKAVSRDSSEVSDALLLERFAASGDEAAFELLVWRHARLVHGVCRRLLREPHDVEDAFQATFLALARKAGAIGKPAAVGCWLYRVAYRVALALRARRLKTAAREKPISSTDCPGAASQVSPLEQVELRAILDEELARLPERFRAAMVLCYLEGRTVEEAAALLGCPKGTVASRLARARARLRGRLVRRGLTLPAGLIGVAVSAAGASAAAPASRVRAAMSCVCGQDGGTVPGQVLALTEGVLRAMFVRKLVTWTGAAAVLAVLLVGGGFVLQTRAEDEPERTVGKAAVPAPALAAVQGAAAPEDGAEDKQAPEGKAGGPRLQVTVRRPRALQVAPYEIYTGRLEAGQVVQIWPQQSGYVTKVAFKPGADVKKGDLLFELDTKPYHAQVEQSKARLAAAQAQLEAVQDELQRLAKLYVEGAVPLATVQERRANEAVAKSKVAEARARLDLDERALQATWIVAPIDGRVTRPLVDPGNLVTAGAQGTLLTTVMALDPMRIVFDMDERSFLRYRRLMREDKVQGPGSPLYLELADEKGFPHEGTLDSFDNVVDPKTGTVRARGLLPNRDKLLLPGAFVRVQVLFGRHRPVLEVPETAVGSGDGDFVYVVNKQNQLERRDVTTAERDGDMLVIEKGLRPDDWVVSDRRSLAGLLRPGLQVEPHRVEAPKK